MNRLLIPAGLLALALAMSCGTSPEPEPTPTPEPTPDCSEGLPEPSVECLPECGNELRVGQPCTEDGGECFPPDGDFATATFCTADFDDTDLWFCTKPCVVDEDCGTDAICQGDPENADAGRGCFPISCVDGDDDDSAGDDDDSAGDDDDSAGDDDDSATPGDDDDSAR